MLSNTKELKSFISCGLTDPFKVNGGNFKLSYTKLVPSLYVKSNALTITPFT
jgi:hypothetical protein